MPASQAQRPGLQARLAGLLSWRTISGKLIIGLVVLFALAGAAVSLVTANSLSNSLMSLLNQQLQSATQTWFSCVQSQVGDNDHDRADQDRSAASGQADAYRANPDGYLTCSGQGQAPGTFEVLLAGKSVRYKSTVQEACPLSATDTATLVALKVPASQNPPGPSGDSSPPEPGGSAPANPPALTRIHF